MVVVVLTPPEPLVDLASMKAHLVVEHDGDDDLIEAYIAAASAHIDGPDGWLGRAIGEQTLQLVGRWGDDCATRIRLPLPPITSVESVDYDDTDDIEQSFSPTSWRLTADNYLELMSGESWPALRYGSDAARITYHAGYETIPPAIVAAVKMMVGDMYAYRETVALGANTSEIKMSTPVEALLSPFRVWA